jgi:hypothetical protein
VSIAIHGVDYDTIKIPLDAIEQELAVQRLKHLARSSRCRTPTGFGRSSAVAGDGDPSGRPTVFTDRLPCAYLA